MNKALFKENIKRFWPISISAFVIYFLSGPFLLLAKKENLDWYIVGNILKNYNVDFIFMNALLPLCISAAVFHYLFKSASSGIMHAFPIDRKTLYFSNIASGAVLSVLPVMLTGIVLFFMKLSNAFTIETMQSWYQDYSDYWTVKGIMLWLLISLVQILFTFCVCSIGSVLCGNNVIAFLTAGALNAIFPLFVLGAWCYSDVFLWGFSDDSFHWNSIAKLHPLMEFEVIDFQNMAIKGKLGSVILEIFIYLLVCVALAYIGYLIYNLRNNENTGDSYVFSIVGEIIGVLLTIIGMSIIGLVTYNEGFKYWGFLLGGFFSFIVARMIVKKTTHTFNKESLKPFAINSFVMLLIVLIFAFDFTGFENRIPKTDKIQVANLKSWNLDNGRIFESDKPDEIADFVKLHEEILENKEDIENPADERWSTIYIEYFLKNGKMQKREYHIASSFLENNEALRNIVNKTDDVEILKNLKNTALEDLEFELYIGTESYSKVNIEGISYEEFVKFKEYNAYEGEKILLNYPKGAALLQADEKLLSDEDKKALINAVCEDAINDPFGTLFEPYGGGFLTIYISIDHPNEQAPQNARGNSGRYSIIERSNINHQAGYEEHYNFYIDEDYPKTLELINEITKKLEQQ